MNQRNLNPSQNRRNYNMRKKGRLAKRRQFNRMLLIFLVLYAVMMLIVGVFTFISLRVKPRIDTKNLYTLEIDYQNEEQKNKKYDAEDVYIDKNFYVPISALQELVEITVTGDKEKVGFIFEKSSEYAKFEIDTDRAWVNGNKVELSQNAKYIDNTLFLPWDFFTTHLQGMVYEENEETKTYVLALADESPSFILKKPASTDNQSESGAVSTTESPLDFVLDLSAYEEYMNPENRDEYLFLVSSASPLDENYVPTDLVGTIYTRDDGRATQKLRKYACLALEAFLKEAEACGVKGVTVTSGYRSYEYQSQLFQNEINITGSVEAAAKNVNPPGSSEHQSGLCVDMHNLSSASVAFAKEPEATWLKENAHKFGYILRYPSDKTDVTGISFEPWHFRYVGRYHATKMYELDMCLEEYVEYINK